MKGGNRKKPGESEKWMEWKNGWRKRDWTWNHEIEKAVAVGFMADFYCFETLFSIYASHQVIELVGFVLFVSSIPDEDDTFAENGQKIVCFSVRSTNGNRFRDNGNLYELNVFRMSNLRFYVMELGN